MLYIVSYFSTGKRLVLKLSEYRPTYYCRVILIIIIIINYYLSLLFMFDNGSCLSEDSFTNLIIDIAEE